MTKELPEACPPGMLATRFLKVYKKKEVVGPGNNLIKLGTSRKASFATEFGERNGGRHGRKGKRRAWWCGYLGIRIYVPDYSIPGPSER